MEYLFSERALKDIKKLEPNVQKRLIKKLDYYVKQRDPVRFAAPLINSSLGQYRFRIGDYRVIFDLDQENLIILRIGHRRNIYN